MGPGPGVFVGEGVNDGAAALVAVGVVLAVVAGSGVAVALGDAVVTTVREGEGEAARDAVPVAVGETMGETVPVGVAVAVGGGTVKVRDGVGVAVVAADTPAQKPPSKV